MARVEEAVYTDIVASIVVDPSLKRTYAKKIPMESGRFKTVGKAVCIDINVGMRESVDWESLHPSLRDNLPRVITRSFGEWSLPGRYQLEIFNSIQIRDAEDPTFKIGVQACNRQQFGPSFDYVSILHNEQVNATNVLDCYYAQALLLFRIPAFSQQTFMFLKYFRPVNSRLACHPKMKRIWLKEEVMPNTYACVPLTTIIDKEHILSDFDSNGMHFFVSNFLFF